LFDVITDACVRVFQLPTVSLHGAGISEFSTQHPSTIYYFKYVLLHFIMHTDIDCNYYYAPAQGALGDDAV